MKIAIDSRSITMHSGSGIGTYTKNLVFNLIHNNNSDNFNLIWTGDLDNDFLTDITNIYITSPKYGGFFEKYFIPNLLIENGSDLYHIPQNGIGFPFDCELNTVVTIHDLIPYIMPETVGIGYLNRFLKDMPNIISNAKGILTVSEYSKKDILKFFPSYPPDKIYVTPLAANNNLKPLNKLKCKKYIQKKYGFDDDFILYLGGFSSRKNVEGLIRAFMKIKNDLTKKHRLLLGGSLLDEGLNLKDLVYSLGLENSVIFLGFVPDSILPILYNACESFIYPSLYEGFGLPPLEAMSCKTPVITSNVTSIPEVCKDAALLIDPYNIDELSYSLKLLLNSDHLKKDLSEKGYKKSLQFSWRQTSYKTYSAYKDILSSI